MNFLIAKDLHQAHLSGTMDFGLKRIQRNVYENQQGQRVTILPNINRLRGHTIDKLYLGRGFEERFHPHELQAYRIKEVVTFPQPSHPHTDPHIQPHSYDVIKPHA